MIMMNYDFHPNSAPAHRDLKILNYPAEIKFLCFPYWTFLKPCDLYLFCKRQCLNQYTEGVEAIKAESKQELRLKSRAD